MEENVFHNNLIWLKSVDSTNEYLKKHKNNLKNKTTIATLNQTDGKGTKNRKFISTKSKTLTFSILFKDVDVSLLPHFPKACSLSLIQTLKSINIKNCSIKWFNDILIKDKKIAGILCESSILKNKADLIAGIGVNILTTEQEFKKLNLNNAGSILSTTNIKIAPSLFLLKFLSSFQSFYSNFLIDNKLENFKMLNYLFQENCSSINKNITVLKIKTKKFFLAKSLKISLNGDLIVSSNNRLLKLNYNDFSIIS